MHTNYEKVQISKSKPKKFSRLCTFKFKSANLKTLKSAMAAKKIFQLHNCVLKAKRNNARTNLCEHRIIEKSFVLPIPWRVTHKAQIHDKNTTLYCIVYTNDLQRIKGMFNCCVFGVLPKTPSLVSYHICWACALQPSFHPSCILQCISAHP